MALEWMTLSGMFKWFRPNNVGKFGKYSMVLYPDAESLEKIRELQDKWGLRNVMKKDDDGYYMSFSRPTSRQYGGKVTTFNPPATFDKDGLPFEENVGNGSQGKIKLEVYSYKDPTTQKTKKAARWYSSMITEHVPFEPLSNYTEEEAKSAKGLAEAPGPTWA